MTKVIDADGHIVEPHTFWQDYIEPRFCNRLPGFAKDSDGIDGCAFHTARERTWQNEAVVGGGETRWRLNMG